jgi:hypothetical protein
MLAFQPVQGVERQPDLRVRSYGGGDRGAVFRLLSFLPELYPRSFDWLEQRLDEVERKRAYCELAIYHADIVGILIETPKGVRRSKISTFFVRSHACKRGAGSLLFQSSLMRWQADGVDNVYVTVAACRQKVISPFLRSKGFLETDGLINRYGPGRDEFIYTLKLN